MKSLLLLQAFLMILAGTVHAQELNSNEYPQVAGLALRILAENCPADKLDKFKFYIGKDGFKFEVTDKTYANYKTLQILARNGISAIYMVKDFNSRGTTVTCNAETGAVEPAALMPW